jgi:septal ring-binding cell division protein DamX
MELAKVRAIMTLHHLSSRPIRVLLPLLLVVLAACNGAQQKLDDATRAYDATDWTKAYNDAVAAQNEAQPPLKQHAAFVAGLAAYRQDRFDEAKTRFEFAETSTDKDVSGQAKVMLGDLLVRDKRPDAAAAKYDQAAMLLNGDAATRARALATAARDQAKASATPPPAEAASEDGGSDGNAVATTAAAKPKKKATDTKPDPKAKPAAKGAAANAKDDKPAAKDGKSAKNAKDDKDDAKSGKGFTIQCGAYVKESDARQRARELTDDAKKAGLPAPTVKRLTGRDGKKLWIVSIGEFKSRADGKKALAKLKVDHAEVLPITG